MTNYHVFAGWGGGERTVWSGEASSREQAVKQAIAVHTQIGQGASDIPSSDQWDYLWVVPDRSIKVFWMESVRTPVAAPPWSEEQ